MVANDLIIAHQPPEIILDLFFSKESSKYIYLKFKEYRFMYMLLLIFLFGIQLFIHFLTNNFFITAMCFFPGWIVAIMPICLFNISLAYDLAMHFEIMFCELNVFIYVLTEFLMVINEFDLKTGSIVFYIFFRCIPSFIITSSVFYYDSIPDEILSTRFKQMMYGFLSIVDLYFTFDLTFVPRKGNYTVQIYDDYGINIQEKCGSAYLCVSIFLVKNFIYAIMRPDDFVIYTMSLRRKI